MKMVSLGDHLQMMKNIEGGGASELHFITSKIPNIINLGEVAITWSFMLSICFIKFSLIMFWFRWSKTYLGTLKYLYIQIGTSQMTKLSLLVCPNLYVLHTAVLFILMASLSITVILEGHTFVIFYIPFYSILLCWRTDTKWIEIEWRFSGELHKYEWKWQQKWKLFISSLCAIIYLVFKFNDKLNLPTKCLILISSSD